MKAPALRQRAFGLLAILFCSGLQGKDLTALRPTTSELAGQSEADVVPASLVEDAPQIHPGDNLDLRVVEDDSFNGKYAVRRGGYIIIPQVGRIKVTGLTTKQAEAAVKKALEDGGQLPKATVSIESSAKPVEEKKEKKAPANAL
jgi:protein involved in polysaccharide export with SLBB domain